MLFKKEFKEAIRAGRVTRTYRTWKKPQARVGGTYNLAPNGIIEVTSIQRVDPGKISNPDARAAGFQDALALKQLLHTEDPVFLVEFSYLGAGLARQPERHALEDPDLRTLAGKLDRMDARAEEPWTLRALQAIASAPGRRAGDLSEAFGWDSATFKRQIRKLKALGLTESLETGYRLSARGEQLLESRS